MSAKAVKTGRAEVEVSIRDRLSRELVNIQKRLQSTGRNIAKIGAAITGTASAGLGSFFGLAKSLSRELVNVQKRLQSTGRNIAKIGAGVSGAAVAGLGSFFGLAKSFASTGDALRKMSLQTGISVEALSLLQHGFVMTARDAQVAAKLSHVFGAASAAVSGLGAVIGAAVAPLVADLVMRFERIIRTVTTWINANRGLVRILFSVSAVAAVIGTGLVVLGSAFIVAGTAIAGIVSAVSGVVAAFVAVKAAIVGVIGFLASAWLPLLIGAGVLVAVGVAAYVFRDKLATAFASVKSAIASIWGSILRIWDVFSATFGGIIAALGAGQLEEAASIAWLGFQAVAWQAIAELANAVDVGLEYLRGWIPGIDSVTAYFKDAFGGIFQAIMAGRWDLAGEILMAKLQLVWTSGIGFLGDAWDMFAMAIKVAFNGVADFISSVWHGAVDGIAQGIMWIMEKTGMAAQGSMNMLKQMQAAEAKARQQQRNQRSDPMQEMSAKMMARQQNRDQMRQRISGLEAEANKAYEDAGAPTIAAVAQDARKRLDREIENAKKGREKQAELAPGPRGHGPLKKEMGKTEGTFTAAAATIIGGSGNHERETAANTRRMAQLMLRVADNTKPNGVAK